MINDNVLYKERLPINVFKGFRLKRASIRKTQWAYRIGAVLLLLLTLFITLIYKSSQETNFSVDFSAIILVLIGCAFLINKSERVIQAQLDGSTPMVICGNHLSIPPRFFRHLAGRSDFVKRDQIEHVKIVRGSGNQWINKNDRIRWDDSPIGIQIILKTGKKIKSGYKPPNTVREISEVLKAYWNIRIEDSQSGMGKGVRYIGDKIIGEYSYDEIMNMNLFEWKEC
jgi:hypothetical protein